MCWLDPKDLQDRAYHGQPIPQETCSHWEVICRISLPKGTMQEALLAASLCALPDPFQLCHVNTTQFNVCACAKRKNPSKNDTPKPAAIEKQPSTKSGVLGPSKSHMGVCTPYNHAALQSSAEKTWSHGWDVAATDLFETSVYMTLQAIQLYSSVEERSWILRLAGIS